MIDAEWAFIEYRLANSDVGYFTVDGLKYHEETNGISRKISDSENWLGRLRLSFIISETAVNIGK